MVNSPAAMRTDRRPGGTDGRPPLDCFDGVELHPRHAERVAPEPDQCERVHEAHGQVEIQVARAGADAGGQVDEIGRDTTTTASAMARRREPPNSQVGRHRPEAGSHGSRVVLLAESISGSGEVADRDVVDLDVSAVGVDCGPYPVE